MQRLGRRRRLGGYELIECLSHGESFDVWRAWHPALARPAALKVLCDRRRRSSPSKLAEAVRRLVCEAQLVASISSSHVVQIYDLAVVDDKNVYLAMELLLGVDLEEFVYRFGALEPRRAVRWLLELCEVLGEVHGRGLIHGDIKPSNLFVGHRGASPEHITLLDFGSARSSVVADSKNKPRGVRRPGTAGYMAPELILGASGDPRADVYALGCAAYWLLAGQRTFEADDDEQLAQLHLSTVPSLSQSRVKHSVPSALQDVILHCLAKGPDDRPADAISVRTQLLRSLAGDQWSDAEARAWWDEHGKRG